MLPTLSCPSTPAYSRCLPFDPRPVVALSPLTPQPAPAPVHPQIVPVVVRGLVLPVLVALRDIAPGEQLLRDYGADWWQAAAAQWREMEEQAGAGAGAGAGPGGLGSVADTLLGAGGAGTYLKEA